MGRAASAPVLVVLMPIDDALMRVHTLPIVVALTIAPLPAVAFEEDEFCTTVTDIARRMNARAGRWLDRSTRHDGVEVDCGLKTLEAKRFLSAVPDDMREGWEARKQRAWNAAYCNNEGWREAIDNGWSIISRVAEQLELVLRTLSLWSRNPTACGAFHLMLGTGLTARRS